MRNYIIDELTSENIETFCKFCDAREMQSSMGGIYWLELPEDLLTDEQREHKDECGPHCCGIEILENAIGLELLVRARNKLRCSCVTYANEKQRSWAMNTLDSWLKTLEIEV